MIMGKDVSQLVGFLMTAIFVAELLFLAYMLDKRGKKLEDEMMSFFKRKNQ